MEKIKRTAGFIFNHPLGKRHPVRSFFRFFIWQLQGSISSRLIIKPFISSLKFYARKGLAGITGNIYAGLHDFDDMGFLLHFLTPGDFFFDIGANAGSYTLLAAGICHANSLAVEPVDSTFDLLKKNIALNGLQTKATLISAGAGAKTGILNFSANEDTTNHVIASDETPGAGTISVTVITVDSLLQYGNPALIKIDVEGFETEVLKGMKETLNVRSLKAIIIELNGSGLRYGFNKEEAHNLLVTKGFRPFMYNPFTRSLTSIPAHGTQNTIYCRDLPFIFNRLKKAPGVKIMGEII